MPLQQEKIKKELINLWTGELAAVVSFWVCFFTMKVWLTDTKMKVLIAYPLLVLSFILIQGSGSGFILLKRMTNPQFLVKHTGKMYRMLRILGLVLLCLGIPVILWKCSKVAVTALSVFILLFAVIEGINYYVVRLSYSYNPMVLIRHLKNGT